MLFNFHVTETSKDIFQHAHRGQIIQMEINNASVVIGNIKPK